MWSMMSKITMSTMEVQKRDDPFERRERVDVVLSRGAFAQVLDSHFGAKDKDRSESAHDVAFGTGIYTAR